MPLMNLLFHTFVHWVRELCRRKRMLSPLLGFFLYILILFAPWVSIFKVNIILINAYPMGCSLACYYYEAFSTFLEWVPKTICGSDCIIHYLDNFLFLGKCGSEDCSNLLYSYFGICKYFNAPLAEEKTVSPVACLDFLGVTIDSLNMEFRLPLDKLEKNSQLLLTFIRR